MPRNPLQTILAGTTIAALTLGAGAALAQQTTIVPTPQGNVAVVPEAATTTQPSVGAIADTPYPILEQWDNDERVAQTLIAQGFSDIYILREGAIMTVTAQRAGVSTELVYSIANGSLVSVDGVKLREGEGRASANDTPNGLADAGVEASAEATADGSDAETGAEAEAEVGGVDGGATGTDSSDPGSEGEADAGGESESDGGEADGSESDSGGESEGTNG